MSKSLSFDVSRMKSYIAAIRSYMAWVLAQPELDLPETSPAAAMTGLGRQGT